MNLIYTVLQSKFKFTQWPDLRLENGDYARITVSGTTYAGLINVTHHYKKQGRAAPTWDQTVEAVQTPKALGTSRTPNRFMFPSFQVSPLSLDLDTEFFRDILTRETQTVQSAMDRLDRHHHYTIQGHCDNFNPADATNYFIGAFGVSTVTAEQRVYVPHGGVINHVYAFWSTVGGLAGTAADVSLYLQKNGTTDSALIETINDAQQYKFFHNEALGFAVDHIAHDYISLKLVCPTWNPQNPTSVKINWVALLDPP
jgi:hypothetical protein